MTKTRLSLTTALVAGLVSPALADGFQADFITHIDAGLPEIDVYLAHPEDPTLVTQITAADLPHAGDQDIYASAVAIPHNPFDADAGGPFPAGEYLGLTLDDWLAAGGTATVSCDGDMGTVSASFTGLVPNAVYTMWYAMVPMPPTVPFTGALDLPLGARDGGQSRLTSNADGAATMDVSFSPCLALTNSQVLSMLALAWHSDGQTYGSSPGDFGKNSHVQIFAPFPAEATPGS